MRLVSLLLAVLLLIGSPAQAVTPTQCGPGPAGSPCDGSGPASLGNTSDTNQGAGNPINVITGNKYQQEVDLPALPGVLGIEIVRHYNSVQSGPRTPPGITGRGWKLSYETDLYPIGNALQVVQADGARIIFVRDPKNPSQCAANNPAHGRIAITRTPRGEEYVWTWSNGRSLSFNHQGRLTQIKVPGGEFVSLARDPAGALVKVTDPQGRSLVLGYPARRSADRFNGVTHIDSPVGRFGYVYGSAPSTGTSGNPRALLANLVRVDLPGAAARHYHYEDPAHPTLLTGLSVAGAGAAGQGATFQRISSWAYDPQGRGILSVRGEPRRLGRNGKPVPGTGIEQVRLDFATPGKTVLTNSLNQTTVYTHAIVGNEYRLLKVVGAGCARCGEANIQYGYDTLGRLTVITKLSPSGQPLATIRTERDTRGRALRVSRLVYHNGRAQPARLQVRYEYAGQSTQPSLIARPSVIAGREAVTRIGWNPYGQPIRVTESGFSPLDDTGQAAAIPISRTTTYTYRSINGRSLLAQIDGPLPNGKTSSPADSDVTRLEWDGRGSAVVMMTPPGGLPSTLQYDAAGRIAEVGNTDNFKTRFTYDAANRLIQTASSAQTWDKAGIKPVVRSYRYDALGHLIEAGTGGPANATDKTERREEPYRPQTRKAFDAAGRLLWQAEALGILKHARYDTEGNLLSSTVQTGRFEQTEQYRYDAYNRLIQVADTTGSVRNVVYGKASDSRRSRRPSAFQTLKDDFGRTVKIASASHGSSIRQYNAADQLVWQRTDKGDIQAYAYDLAGQRIRHTVLPRTGKTETTTWRYQGGRLVEIRDPVQSERIRYNERGQPEARAITLELASGVEATYVTRYNYTADGSLQSQSLPDGSQILYERNRQGQVVALSQKTSPWTLFGWGKTTLVKDLERDLVGLRHLIYGNGIRGQWQRSRQGVLARVVYTQPEGRIANPSRVVAASRAAVRQGTVGSVLGKLLPAAHAQTPPPAPSAPPGALGIPADPQALFDARLLYDGAGNVLLQKQLGQGLQRTQAYAYDRQSQLVAAQSASPSSPVTATSTAGDARVWRYHYDENGNRVLAQEHVPVTEMGHTRKASYELSGNAMLSPASDREYVWNIRGQLIAIRQENRELARYRYNHHGLRVSKQAGTVSTHALYNEQRQRIADLDVNGRITRQYLWLGDHLIATLDTRQPKAPQSPAEGFWQELTQTVHALWNSATGNTDRLAFVHVNHLGAPIAATNPAGKILWQADYAPYGKVIKVGAVRPDRVEGQHSAYSLALRLPGQWEDQESGLYYNDFRYYDPQAGRYLSPDPLGRMAEVLGSPNAYTYVNNNPASYIDPWGLILFAFDGTGNTEASRTNVYWLSQAYDDNDTTTNPDGTPAIAEAEEPFYVEGPGTGGIQWLDGAVSYTLKGKINSQLDSLDKYVKAKWDNEINVQNNTYSLDKPLIITLDIVGFSRGSAAARDFANQVITRKNSNYYNKELFGFGQNDARYNCVAIKIRFMGLFDTVLSTALGDFSLGISNSQIEYVAQAVAVNEHRVLFPLVSIEDGYGGAGFTPNRVEKGFIGAHSDIGGGYAGVGGDGGDLSDVALNWMYAQARLAGVTMKSLEPDQLKVTNPILHDETNVLPWNLPGFGGWSSDRDVEFPDQTLKGKDAQFDGMTYLKSQQAKDDGTNKYISYYNYAAGNKAGTVDMDEYKQWLQSSLNLALQ